MSPCICPLAAVPCGPAIGMDLGEGLLLIVGRNPDERDGAAAIAPSRSMIASRSAVPGCRAVLLAADGRIGLDVETMARVALNATAEDAWLAESERHIVGAVADPVLELACRWTLKEAYGKALGVGLALPLDELAFRSGGGHIVLGGAAAPGRTAGWRFALYRRGDTIIGIARQAMPFAPIGRNPPTPSVDR